MGNVQASGVTPESMMSGNPLLGEKEAQPPGPPGLPPPTKPDNPGTMEDLHRKVQDVYPGVFEGLRCVFQKQIDPEHSAITHNITLTNSKEQKSGYKVSGNYVGTPLSPTEVDPLFMADGELGGSFNCQGHKYLSPDLKLKFMGAIDQWSPQGAQLTIDYRDEKSSSALTLGNVNPFAKSGTGVLHYLQRMNKQLSLGSELIMQFAPQAPGGKIAVPSLAAKYEGSNFTAAGTLGMMGARATYHQQCSESLQAVSEIDINLRMQEAVGSCGYQVDIPKSQYTYRGKVDTNYNMSASIEKGLSPLGVQLLGSVNHNFGDGKTSVGIGLVINVAADMGDPSQPPPQ